MIYRVYGKLKKGWIILKEKILIIVPCFNEEENIPIVVDEIRTSIPDADILIVNDCSTDKSSRVAHSLANVKVIDLPVNLGIGGAVQTGFKYAAGNDYDYAVQLDGDGQHIASEALRLIKYLKLTGSDMVIGSRFLDVKSFRTSTTRRMGIKVFQLMYRIMLKKGITDGTSGFRAYSRSTLKYLCEHYPDDYPEPEAIIMLNKQGFKICEVGVEMRERLHGISSITPLKSMYYMTKVIISMFFSFIRE